MSIKSKSGNNYAPISFFGHSIGLMLLSLLVIVSVLVECQEQLTVESRQQKDNDELIDTIKYLEKLDKYFSQMARPRFGRSELKQPMVRMQSLNRISPQVGWSEPATTAGYNSIMDFLGNRLALKYRDGLAY